jgi:hypothetical protein
MDRTDKVIGIRRTAEMAAIFMIGDGLLGIAQPSRHVGLWRSRHAVLDAAVRPFEGTPNCRRAYGMLQVAAGLALASRLTPSRSRKGA